MNTRTHGIMDYLVCTILIVSPWLFGFAEGGAETWVPVAVGATALFYSVFTDYEYALVRTIPMSMHLTLDFASGVFLAVSPWIFGFADRVFIPHLIFGLPEIGAAMMTKRGVFSRRAARAV